jgi:hemoglobin
MNPVSPLDAPVLATLVNHFHEKARHDAQPGPLFHAAMHEGDEQQALPTSLRSSVALRAGGYRGNTMATHRPRRIRSEHFNRWRALWQVTRDEELDEVRAAQLLEYANASVAA